MDNRRPPRDGGPLKHSRREMKEKEQGRIKKLQFEPQNISFAQNPPQNCYSLQNTPHIKEHDNIVCQNHFSVLENDPEISISCQVREISRKKDRRFLIVEPPTL